MAAVQLVKTQSGFRNTPAAHPWCTVNETCSNGCQWSFNRLWNLITFVCSPKDANVQVSGHRTLAQEVRAIPWHLRRECNGVLHSESKTNNFPHIGLSTKSENFSLNVQMEQFLTITRITSKEMYNCYDGYTIRCCISVTWKLRVRFSPERYVPSSYSATTSCLLASRNRDEFLRRQ